MSLIDTLRLSSREQSDLLRQLEYYEQDRSYDNLRTEPRQPYRSSAGLILALEHPGGSRGLYLVRPRNLSAGGVGFLHGSYLHSDSGCAVLLRDANGNGHKLRGRVAWCRHIDGRVHEIGVAFRENIDPRQFLNTCVRTSHNSDEDTPSVPMPSLAGRVLHVDDTDDERALMRFQLGQLGVEVISVNDGPQALDRLKNDTFDLVLTRIWLPGMDGLELTEKIRAARINVPVLAMTADTNPAMHHQATERGCEAVVMQPYSFETLVAALRPYLGDSETADGSVDRLVSQQWTNAPMRPLIRQYVQGLNDRLERIAALTEAPQPEPMLRKMCLDLKGSAGSYGYPAISDAAHRLAQAVEADDDLAPAHQRLAQLCDAARKGLAAADRGPGHPGNSAVAH